ncbi:MAG TPA: hypothetical protein VHR43_02880 [Gemmatimonadales bacterium]|jgi:hypothetical protein|nr:hypothetical protein [Gemmatimonadales bacterium]
MKPTIWRQVAVALALAGGSVLGGGCVAAAAAGAAGAIYATTRGVESLVARPIDQVAATAESVMRSMSIVQDASSTEKGGSTRELKGKQGDLDVTVQLEQQDTATTKVEVYARKNLAEWDKDYARTVLERIVKGQ